MSTARWKALPGIRRLLDTIADNIHWVERTLLNAYLQTSVTCVYKRRTDVITLRENAGLCTFTAKKLLKGSNCRSHVILTAQQ